MESYSRKNSQVKHGKYGSIMAPTHFPLEAIILGLTLAGKGTPPPHSKIYPQNLSIHYLAVRGSKKQQRRG